MCTKGSGTNSVKPPVTCADDHNAHVFVPLAKSREGKSKTIFDSYLKLATFWQGQAELNRLPCK